MANLLALEWEQNRCQVVVGQGSRSGTQVEGQQTWPVTEPLTKANGEALGKRFREFLQTARLSAAPLLVGVSRDRVVLKELRHPPVPAADEPALVRFQTFKELTESPEEVVFDYCPVPSSEPGGQGRALVVLMRREVLEGFQAFARGAGLKLLGVMPRPFVFGSVVPEKSGTTAVLHLADKWAELGVVQNGRLVFARSLARSESLAGEVKRALTVLSGQPGSLAPDMPGTLYLRGDEPPANLKQALGESTGLPVESLPEKGGTAGALISSWSKSGGWPVNFLKPRGSEVDTGGPRRRKILLAAVAAVLLLGTLFAGNRLLAGKKSEIARLQDEGQAIENQLQGLAQDGRDLQALKEWEQLRVPWLDELYDLTARFPHQIGLRVTRLNLEPIARSTNAKKTEDKYVARMSLGGLVSREDDHLLTKLVDSINRDGHCRATLERIKPPEFTLKVDLSRQPPAHYLTKLVPPPRRVEQPKPPPTEEPFDLGDSFQGGAP